ncbi:MAG: hypothetical protein ACLSAF_04935 [Intestinimonas sp.]
MWETVFAAIHLVTIIRSLPAMAPVIGKGISDRRSGPDGRGGTNIAQRLPIEQGRRSRP